MDLLSVARTGMAVHQLTQEDLAAIFGRLEMSAAAEAMRKSKIARDPKVAVLTAISHLEAAEAASRERVKTSDNYEILGIGFMSNDAALRAHEVRYHWFALFYIYVAMTTLYYQLEEWELAVDSFQKLGAALEGWQKFRSGVEWTPGHYLNPKNWRYLAKELPITTEEVSEFIEIFCKWFE